MGLIPTIRVLGAAETARAFAGKAALSNTALTRNLLIATKETEGQVKKQLTGTKAKDPFWGVLGSKEEGTLAVRSGLTRAATTSSRSVLIGPRGQFYTFVVNGAPHMAMLEQGGTIHGKPWLRIPTGRAQTPSGVDRLAGTSARSLPGGFIWPSRRQKTRRAKNLWVATNEGGKLTLWYMLTKGVTIKAHKPFQTAVAIMEPRVRELCGDKVASEVVLGHQ